MSAKSVACFGELLLRFSPDMSGGFFHQHTTPVYVGGAELNVATALAKWDVPVKYITALPDNYLSKEIELSIREKNIDTSSILFSGKRIGIYYLPEGADLKNRSVIYDREYSSFSQLNVGDVDWDETLKDVAWLHISAISPALNENIAALCLEAARSASSKNIPVSIDLNYRARLWQYGKQPVDIMPDIVQYCDVVMGNIWAAESLLGIRLPLGFESRGTSKEKLSEQAITTSEKIIRQYPKCSTIANTFRLEHGEGTQYFASLYHHGHSYLSKTYISEQTTGKVGSGDCFMAGLIYGMYNNDHPHVTIEYAAAAAFAKLHEKGDSTSKEVTDIKKIMEAHG